MHKVSFLLGLSLLSGILSLDNMCFSQTTEVSPQTNGAQNTPQPDQKPATPTNQSTTAKPAHSDNSGVTQLEINLQGGVNSMEPEALPRRIRVDDRAHVRFVLRNLSPLDVCTRTGSAPTVTPETSVAESTVGTIAKLGAFAVGTTMAARSQTNYDLSLKGLSQIETLSESIQAPQCSVEQDPEYAAILKMSQEFFSKACGLIGSPAGDARCTPTSQNQTALANEIDSATRELANFAGQDFRGLNQSKFAVDANVGLKHVRNTYTSPLTTIEAAGKLQAMQDEMFTWSQDLHKKYDYSTSTSDAGPTAPPPVIPGALMVSPTTLSFTPSTLTQVIQISSGGQSGAFTATASSEGNWLLLSKPGSAGSLTVKDVAPSHGLYNLVVTVRSDGLGKSMHYGAITISGTGAAKGMTIINVTFSTPEQKPAACSFKYLREIDEIVDRAKAVMSLIGDNNKTIESAQGGLKTAYMAVLKTEDDFNRRLEQGIIKRKDGVIVQEINLGTDRKATSTGYFSCVSDLDGKTPTTASMYYSILYQDVPRWTASVGLLTSFQEKKVIGISNQLVPGSNPPANSQVFAVTDRSQVQFIPMAYVNRRVPGLGYWSTHYGKGQEDELVWTANFSGGFGINPNSGTNQPEFFAGMAVGLNRFLFHPGVHIARVPSLGGGFTLGSAVPSGLSNAPVNWSYHPAFSIGFSVRVAPY